MKTIKATTSKLILFCSISILFFSCTDNLTRDKAKEIIIKDYQRKYEGTAVDGCMKELIQIKKSYTMPLTDEVKKMLDCLTSEGMITISEEYHNQSWTCPYSWTEAKVNLTEKTKVYRYIRENEYNYDFEICELIFGKITGIKIQEQSKTAEVNYTLKRGLCNSCYYEKSLSKTIAKSVTMSLYDDGWRINK